MRNTPAYDAIKRFMRIESSHFRADAKPIIAPVNQRRAGFWAK
jgi:hypothetical protein